MQSRLFIEWAVKSHGCDMKSLRLVRGFHVVPVDRAIKTIIGYDLNLLIEIIAYVCLPYLSPCFCKGARGIRAKRDALKAHIVRYLAGVNGQQENLRQSVAT